MDSSGIDVDACYDTHGPAGVPKCLLILRVASIKTELKYPRRQQDLNLRPQRGTDF